MTNLVWLSLGHQVQGNPRKQIRRMKMLTSQRSPGRSEALLDPFAVVQNLKYFVIYFLQIRTLMDISVCTSFKWTCTFWIFLLVMFYFVLAIFWWVSLCWMAWSNPCLFLCVFHWDFTKTWLLYCSDWTIPWDFFVVFLVCWYHTIPISYISLVKACLRTLIHKELEWLGFMTPCHR